MSAHRLIPEDFAQGAVRYSDYDPSQPHSRIIVPVRFSSSSALTAAVVDTGSPWSILSPEEAEALGIDPQSGIERVERFLIRGGTTRGWLHRIPVSLEATTGEGLVVDATVFIPQLDQGQEWASPNFLGLGGFLERIGSP
jgi:hypothetical protein